MTRLVKLLKVILILLISISIIYPVKANDDNPSDNPYYFVPGGGSGGNESNLESGTYNWLYNIPTYSDFNCYAFAIGQTSKHYNPGDFSGTAATIRPSNMSTLQSVVINDLKKLGYTNVKSVTSSYSPTSTEILIAMRVGYNYGNNTYDYHFMRYNQTTGYWYHKPGDSAILKYKYNAKTTVWYYEEYDDGEWILNSNLTYNSEIKYVVFSY